MFGSDMPLKIRRSTFIPQASQKKLTVCLGDDATDAAFELAVLTEVKG